MRYTGPSRATYLLRLLPPDTVAELAARVDAAVTGAFEKVCHWDPLRPAEAAQVRLPLRHGGEGYPSAAAVAPAAYLGCTLQTLAEVASATGLPAQLLLDPTRSAL